MNAQLFTDAMSELNDKYVMEAVSYQRKTKSQTRVWLSRVACFFLVFLLTGSAILTFSVEARAVFFGWVREQADNFYHYFFEGEAAPSQPVKYELGWMPEGLEYITTLDIDNGECFIYKDAQGFLIQFSYSPNGDNRSWGVDGVGDIQKTVKVNGNKADLYISRTDDQTSSIIWTNERNDFFTISAPFDEETLIKMAENVRVKPLRYELCYVPDNCIFVTSYETAGGEVYIYTDEQDTLIQFSYTSEPNKEDTYVIHEEAERIEVTVNEYPAEIFRTPSEDETDGIVWTAPETNTLFFISGHFDEDTLIRMAESVRVKPVRYELGYVPENCVFVTSYEIPGGKSFVYTDEKESLICFTYQVGADGGSFFVDNAKAEKIDVTINGCTGEISLYKDEEETDHIIWTDSTNTVLFYITGHFDQETFIKMAESVIEIE